MKTAIFVAFVVAASLAIANADLTPEQRQKIQENGKICISETGVDTDLITKARQGTFTDDEKLKAFTFCMSRKSGFQNDKGEIQRDVLKQKLSAALDEAVAEQLLEKCLAGELTGADSAYESFKCYYENTPIHLTVF